MRINHVHPTDTGVHEVQHHNSWLCQDENNGNSRGKDGQGNIWVITSFVESEWAVASIKYKIPQKGIMYEKHKFTVLETYARYRFRYGMDIDIYRWVRIRI